MKLNFHSCLFKKEIFVKPRWVSILRTLKTEPIRVRFAPSPTGYLHLGGLRTALYNYLFARSRGGTFILRIEDTDQSRKVEGSVESLLDTLKWAGIEYDEGPDKGGDRGPYIQSERLNVYKSYAEQLVCQGSAYRCFCTPRRLGLLRRDAAHTQQLPRYDNKCRHLTAQEVVSKMASSTPYCIRFKLTSNCQYFEDLIFGGIAYDVSLNEGDPVLMKGDGFPTYHLANVVDDHLMGITHVLRGVEWQISTTKHVLLHRAFNWQPPVYGHLPLIVNADGTKLSKRQNDVKVENYKSRGVFPLALVNYVTLSGGGFDHVAGAGVQLYTMDELAQQFKLENISSHPSRLNPDLLEECNRLDIKRLLKEERTATCLVRQVQTLVRDTFVNEKLQVSEEHVRSVLNWATSRVSNLHQLVLPSFSYLWILPIQREVDGASKVLLSALVEELELTSKFDEKSLKKGLKEFATRHKVKFSDFMHTVREALTGRREGPGVAEMMALLGRQSTLQRIRNVALVE